MGQVLQAGAGQAPARQAAIGAGIPKEVPADTINKVCASSIRAIELADLMVRSGQHDLVVTGGMESMSNAPYLLPKAASATGSATARCSTTWSSTGSPRRSTAAHGGAEPRASRASSGSPGRSRTHGRYARRNARPPRRTRAATADEIVPVGELERDEGIRRDTIVEKLAALEPVFDPEGTTTAGNAPGRQRRRVVRHRLLGGVARRARARGAGNDRRAGQVADDFAYLARTPARAGALALEQAGRAIGDVARVEINEAFSSVASNSTRLLGVDEEIVNVNGGAVALGHPIGASGGRIVTTIVHELRRSGGGLGLAAICSGGGQGDALLVEV